MSRSGNAVGIILIFLGLYVYHKYGLTSMATTVVGAFLVLFAVFWPDGR